MRRGFGSAVPPAAVVCGSFLLLYAHRVQPSAPCIRRFGPSPGWATMASADFSGSLPTVTRAVVRYSGQSWRPLEVRHAFFSRTRRIYPHGVPNDHWASPSLAGLPTPHWPDIRFLYVKSEISSSAFFRSRLATDTLA